MSDHLPECTYHPGYPEPVGPMGPDAMVGKKPCICDRLRACESRIRSGYADVYAEGIAAALDAARAAVIGTCGHTKYEGCSPCSHDDAVAAIDALREESK